MKIVLLALLGLVLGALGGAVLGITVGLACVEISEISNFEGYSGVLVFFTFMPLGAAIGGLGGALTFGLWPSATPRSPSNANRVAAGARKFTKLSHLCNAKTSIAI